MKLLTQAIRIFVGVLFILSGLVKTIDPIGFSYKLEEYFAPDVLDLPFLVDLSLSLSVFFVIFEVILGLFLLLGVFKKFTLWSLFILIVFFSFLTFYSAYFNKVTDCGCFGDALKLEPWESFIKDIILLIGIIWLLIYQKYIQPLATSGILLSTCLFAFILTGYIAFKGVYDLPLVDFRPYAVGKNINEGMMSARELGLEPPQEIVMYTMVNTKTNEEVIIPDSVYVAEKKYWEKGTLWKIQSTEQKVIKEGYTPPIHDFVIDCLDKGDKTFHYLERPILAVFITPIVPKANEQGIKRTIAKAKEYANNGVEVLHISSDNLNISYAENCVMDGITLKTIIRSNPGLILLKSGTIVGKYNWKDYPTSQEVKEIFKLSHD